MMNKGRGTALHPATFFIVGTWLVVFLSWIGNVYGWFVVQSDTGELIYVQSLLSPEGVRWWIRSVMDNFMLYAWPEHVIVAALGVGVALHAFADCKQVSPRKRRAFTAALVVAGLYIFLVLLGSFSDWSILRGVNGELARSPLKEGLLFLIVLGIGLTGLVFGFASGRYRKDSDLMAGLTYLLPFLGRYFVISFFASQLFACFAYTKLGEFFTAWWGNSGFPWSWLYYLPLLLAFYPYQHHCSNSAR